MALGTGLSVSDLDLMTLDFETGCVASTFKRPHRECLMARSLLLLETQNSYIQSYKDSINSMILCYHIFNDSVKEYLLYSVLTNSLSPVLSWSWSVPVCLCHQVGQSHEIKLAPHLLSCGPWKCTPHHTLHCAL